MQFIKKYEDKLKNICKMYLLPLLLCFSVMRIIINTYFDFLSTTFTIVSVVFMGLLFFVYEKIKPKKIIRGIVFFVIGGAVLIACRVLMTVGFNRSGVWFMNWFYVSTQDVGRVNEYSATVLIFFSFFLGSIVYYFSIIRFRASGLMLAVLLPFIIYGKRALAIEDLDMVLMVTVYLALVIHGKLTADDVKKDTVFNYSYVIASLVFVTFVGMLTMFVPKPEIESYLENNRNFFDLRVNAEVSVFSGMTEESSARFGQDATGEILFRAQTDSGADVLYLRRQTFDEYSNERWRGSDFITSEMNGYGTANNNPVGSAKSYFNIMKTIVSEADIQDPAAEQCLNYFNTAQLFSENDLRYISLDYEESFVPRYIPAELNIDPSSRNNTVQVYKTTHSEAYNASGNNSEGVTYFYYPQPKSVIDFAKSQPFDSQGFRAILLSAREQKVLSLQNYTSITDTMEMFTDKSYYEISERLENLAKEITKDCVNDYQKAEALVNYFATNGFTYDADYRPKDESIDYFVFESKTGSCTSYATAMALMARSVGVPARYVEGFAAYERDGSDETKFLVKDLNAHAFVECFIPAVGWMTFDPTVPEYMNVSASSSSSSGTLSTIAKYLGRAALFIAVGFVLIFIVFLDRIDERIFRIRLRFKPMERKPILVYSRVIKLINRVSGSKRFDGYTPHKLENYVLTELDKDISLVVRLFEKTCFGGIEPTKEEFEQAYAQYKDSWKALAKGKRKEKKKALNKPKLA